MRTLPHTLKTRWLLIAAAAAIAAAAVIAIIAGANFGLRTSGGAAQEQTPPNVTFPPPTDEEWDKMSDSSSEGRQFTVRAVAPTPDYESMSKAQAESRAAPPGSGFYLVSIDKFIRLPKGVELLSFIVGISCSEPGYKCPRAPVRVLKNGDEYASVDSSGVVFVAQSSLDDFSFLNDEYDLEIRIIDFVYSE